MMRSRIGEALIIIALLVGCAWADEFSDGFDNPPQAASPQTFWHWMNGNITKEGISADLEAMKAMGIGGVFLFDVEGKVTESVPVYLDKPVRQLTPEWFEMLRWSASECKRLGLELSLMNCTGWTTSGGPWVTPDKSMMRIAWSEKYVKGPGRIEAPLPKPPCDYANYQNLTKNRQFLHDSVPPEQRFYHDVAVVAYRLTPSSVRIAANWPPKMTCSESSEATAKAVDGDNETSVTLKEKGFLQFDFGEPATLRGVEYVGSAAALEASEDGVSWRNAAELEAPRQWDYPRTYPVQETTARYFRIYMEGGGSIADVKLSGDSMVLDYQPKASFHGVWQDIKVAEDRIGAPTPDWAKATINAADVLNLTDRLRADGSLDWEAPAGDWMIVHFCCAPIGRLNGPCAREFAGLECDKLDADAVARHFNGYAGRVADELKDFVGAGFNAVHVDSWEAGDLNFTPTFVEEFQRRRGYDPTPYLLVHGGGRVVDGPDVSDRFLWDARRTIADLLADNYFGELTRLCHERGLKFQGEIAGVMVQTTADQLQIKGRCDLPMGEFQMPNCVYGDNWARWDARETASGAHIHDRPIAAAEAFTTFDHWMTDPYGLKGVGDLALAMGINRIVFHTWALNPWLDRAPGMTMGPFGVNFSRMNTWSGRPAKAYGDYLRRSQYLLQRGNPVADILYFYGEGAPNTLPAKPEIKPVMPDGYLYDGCDAETLAKNARVENGRVFLNDGASYRLLVLKDDERMTPETLAKIRDLIKAGATVVGRKPIESPSLHNYPQCDEHTRALASEIWGRIDGASIVERAIGAGRIFWGPSVGEVLNELGVVADCEIIHRDGDGPIEWTHRRDGDADIYFISNQKNVIDHGASLEIWERRYDSFAVDETEKDAVSFDAKFRVKGKQPELWDAVAGSRRELPEFHEENGRIVVPLTLSPSGSCFIVFRRPIENTCAGRNFSSLKSAVTLSGSWDVAFDPKWGGPDHVVFESLEDWTARPEPGIKYYSGRATYRKTFDAEAVRSVDGKRVHLDLGRLRSLAEIRLNGVDLGVLWCPPWRTDVTNLIKPVGNELEIDIVNLWANRIIGDMSLPLEQRLTWTSLTDTISALKPGAKLTPAGLYGPVTIKIEE